LRGIVEFLGEDPLEIGVRMEFDYLCEAWHTGCS
jgi:hypothetical protein